MILFKTDSEVEKTVRYFEATLDQVGSKHFVILSEKLHENLDFCRNIST